MLQMGQEGPAKQLRDDSNAIKKLGFEAVYSYTGLAAVPARFALERQAWKEAAALEPRGSQFPQSSLSLSTSRSAAARSPLRADPMARALCQRSQSSKGTDSLSKLPIITR